MQSKVSLQATLSQLKQAITTHGSRSWCQIFNFFSPLSSACVHMSPSNGSRSAITVLTRFSNRLGRRRCQSRRSLLFGGAALAASIGSGFSVAASGFCDACPTLGWLTCSASPSSPIPCPSSRFGFYAHNTAFQPMGTNVIAFRSTVFGLPSRTQVSPYARRKAD
jgi:hypothetical protein